MSNSEKTLHAGLDQHRIGSKKSMADASGVREAARLMPRQPLVSLWLNLDEDQQAPEAKAVFKPCAARRCGSLPYCLVTTSI